MRLKRGFTLVELLVVIGIIAVLLSILLPSISRARETANRTACLSNLRQIAVALQMYLNDNDGYFPNAANGVQCKEDWIYWQSGRDPEQGAIAGYMGGFSPKHYTCPSDEIENHPGPNPYPFSYTLNARIAGAHQTATTYYPLFTPTRNSQIVRPWEKILVIDEAWTGIDDGAWAPTDLNPDVGHSHNMLSNRHDKQSESIRDANAGKGNVIFADCHGDFIDRKWCLMERYVDPRAR